MQSRGTETARHNAQNRSCTWCNGMMEFPLHTRTITKPQCCSPSVGLTNACPNKTNHFLASLWNAEIPKLARPHRPSNYINKMQLSIFKHLCIVAIPQKLLQIQSTGQNSQLPSKTTHSCYTIWKEHSRTPTPSQPTPDPISTYRHASIAAISPITTWILSSITPIA